MTSNEATYRWWTTFLGYGRDDVLSNAVITSNVVDTPVSIGTLEMHRLDLCRAGPRRFIWVKVGSSNSV
jgi:hypothetical protein